MCVDRLLFTCVNTILGVTGVAILIVAVVVHKYVYNLEITGNYRLPAVPELLYVSGALSIVAAIVGTAAACLGRMKILLILYIGIVVVLAIAQLTASGLALSGRETAKKTALDAMKSKMSAYHESAAVTIIWDQFQKNWKCCGLDSAGDWLEKRGSVPESCCRADVQHCDPSNTEHVYSRGCGPVVSHLVDQGVNILGYVALGVLAVQAVAVVLALLMIIFGGVSPFCL